MWRAMALSSAVALAAFPLYLALGQRFGVEGLAWASVLAMSVNALITVSWLRVRAGAPRLRPLGETLLRSVAIVVGAGLVARSVSDRMPAAESSALFALTVGGILFGAVALGLVRMLGDAPTRDGLSRITSRVFGRWARRRLQPEAKADESDSRLASRVRDE